VAQVKAAEADAESKYLAGLGISRQRQAIVNGLRDSVNDFSSAVHGTTASQIMDMMVLTQVRALPRRPVTLSGCLPAILSCGVRRFSTRTRHTRARNSACLGASTCFLKKA